MAEKTGIAWTDATKQCFHCKEVKPLDAFARDKARPDGLTRWCRVCRNARQRQGYAPKGAPEYSGPRPHPPRDGDARQARKRVNQMVMWGKLPRPNTIPCHDCGDTNGKHEYDHYRGYGAAHHLDVQSVCVPCHHARERARKVAA